MDDLIRRVRDRADGVTKPLTEKQVTQAEEMLGFPLSSVLRELYLRVGDHGFGPGHGFLPLQHAKSSERSAVALYQDFLTPISEDPGWIWRERLLPICDWGCAMYSCVDCATGDGAVFTFEYVQGAPLSASLAPTRSTFATFLSDWLDGESVFEPVYVDDPARARTGINPFTKEPMVIMGRRPRFWPA